MLPRRSPFTVRRSPFTVHRSAFTVRRASSELFVKFLTREQRTCLPPAAHEALDFSPAALV
jgi:hypothetical protein